MSPVPFTIQTADNGEQFATVFINGQMLSAASSHANFEEIRDTLHEVMAGAQVDEQHLADLFDVAATVERKFEQITDRITLEGGQVLFDGELAQPGLSNQILRFMDEGLDFMPLVRFMENIMENPSLRSRTQAWEWLNNHDFTITPDGEVVIYKGMVKTADPLVFMSVHSGTAYVNGDEQKNQQIEQREGDIVSMPREQVMDDPNEACSYGLHVGTYSYAQGYGNVVARVIINPADIVSVPVDGAGQKIRVCDYLFEEVVEHVDTSALYWGFEDDDEDEDLIEDLDDAEMEEDEQSATARFRRITEIERELGFFPGTYNTEGCCPKCDDITTQLKAEGF